MMKAKWYNSNFKYRKEIKTNHNLVRGENNFANFPLKIELSDENLKKARKDGKDIVFTNEDGITELKFKRINWDQNSGKLRCYVLLPTLKTNEDTILYMYYGNPSSTIDKAISSDVWDDDLPIVSGNLLKIAMQFLEDIFSKNWLLDIANKEHPAFHQWRLCNDLDSNKVKLRYPKDKEAIEILSHVMLNAFIFSTISKGNKNILEMGDLNSYGDEKVQRKINPNIIQAEKFYDLLVELYVGAWNYNKNRNVIPLEEENFPDLKIIGKNQTVFVECKNLKTISKNKILNRIKKANKQIKYTNSKFGTLILDISNIENLIQKEDDSIPDLVNRVVNIVQNALRGEQNRSIYNAIIVWDEYSVKGEITKGQSISFRRRTRNIIHALNNKKIQNYLTVFEGFTAFYVLK